MSGYPPFYPDVNAARVRSEPPAPLTAHAGIPAAVIRLIERCLARLPADRPADMETVARELSAALNELPAASIVNSGATASAPAIAPPAIRPPVAQGEPLRGEWHRPTATPRNDDDLRQQGFRRGLGVAAVLLALISIGVVFFALPRWVAGTQPAKPVAAKTPGVEAAQPERKKETDFAALARARQQAEEQRDAIDERFGKLRERAVDQWGGEEFKRASDELAAGDKDFAAREYLTAAQHFAAIDPLLR